MNGRTAFSIGARGPGSGPLGLLLLLGLLSGCGQAGSSAPEPAIPAGDGAPPAVTSAEAGAPGGASGVDPAAQETTGSAAPAPLEETPSLEELELALDEIPEGLEFVTDEALRLPGDPAEWPPVATIGGEPVRILREYHPSTGELLRIATARPVSSGTEGAPVLHGPEWRYHENGFPSSVQWWRDDVSHGPIRQWRPIGTIAREGRFHNGQRDGLWRMYSKKGQLIERAVYAAGTPVGARATWFASGQSKEAEAYLDGRLEGRRQVWDRDGILMLDEHYKAGTRHGRWSDFHPGDGDPREWGTYEEGKRTGLWQRGSPSGAILSAVEYADGAPHGLSRTWSEEGILVEEFVYVEGARTGPCRTWYADGTPQSEGRLENGRRVGRWTYWKSDGTLNERWSGLYEDDLRVAPLSDDQGGS